MEQAFYLLTGFTFLVAIVDWRWGLYLCLVLDVLRDPARKLSDSQSVWMTVAAASVWGGVFLGVLRSESGELLSLFGRYPKMRASVVYLIAAMVPAALLACVLYPSGYLLAIVGGVSYLAPLLGIGIGFVLPREDRSIYRLLAFYTVFNAVMLSGTLLEFAGLEWRVLGGVRTLAGEQMDWIRVWNGMKVQLIAGFYRSPDISALHAAHVVVFSAMLAMNPRSRFRSGWVGIAAWAGFCLLLAGRRKMMAIPLIFMAVFLLLCWLRGGQSRGQLRGFITVALLLFVGVVLVFREVETSGEYITYASTLLTQGAERAWEIVAGSVITTVRQTGVRGTGLGSVTQGSHYTGARIVADAWQEDGISRLFRELGLIGVILIAFAARSLLQTARTAVQLVPADDSLGTLQMGLLAIVAANAASFVASHQQYSGDPGSALLVTMLFGMVMGLPRVSAGRQQEVTVQPVAQTVSVWPQGRTVVVT